MSGLYFWGVIALGALVLGAVSSRGKSAASKSKPRGLRAIGSPLEFVLLALFLGFLWYAGAFNGSEAGFLWGVLLMLAVPVGAVVVFFWVMGSLLGSRRGGDDDAS